MRDIRIAVIGAGRAGMIHARNFAGAVPGARLVCLADPDEASCRRGASALDVEAVTDVASVWDGRADAVVIATPTRFHCELAVAAARAGLHVLCEKPMAVTPDECVQMAQAVAEAGVQFQIGFMRRFDPGFCEAAERLEGGEVGSPVLIKSLTYGPSVPKPWMFDISGSNGPLAEVNSHDIDTLRWLAGSKIEEVHAIAGNFRSPQARAEHPDFYDNVVMNVRFGNGVQGNICGAQGVGYGYDARCEILGEHGLITVGALPANTVRAYTSDGLEGSIVHSWMHLFRDAYLAEDADFVTSIHESRAPRVGVADGLQALRVVLAGNRSIRERRPVRIEEIGGDAA